MNTKILEFFAGFALLATALSVEIAMAETRVPNGTVEGRWLAEDIRGGGVIDRAKTVLEIAGDGQISGTGGCNRMSGRAIVSGDKISFGPMAATKMACAPAAMDQEAKFFATLGDVRTWRVDPVRGKLALLDERGDTVIVLVRM